MNLGQAKDIALKLINAEGDTDFQAKIYNLANDSQIEIASIKSIKSIFTFIQVGIDDIGLTSYTIPAGTKEIRYIEFNDTRFYDYKVVMEEMKIYIPKIYDGDFKVYVFKNPTEIISSTQDSYTFEIDSMLHNLIPYYCASILVKEDNKELSNELYNIYMLKLKAIKQDTDSTPSTIINVLGW